MSGIVAPEPGEGTKKRSKFSCLKCFPCLGRKKGGADKLPKAGALAVAAAKKAAPPPNTLKAVAVQHPALMRSGTRTMRRERRTKNKLTPFEEGILRETNKWDLSHYLRSKALYAWEETYRVLLGAQGQAALAENAQKTSSSDVSKYDVANLPNGAELAREVENEAQNSPNLQSELAMFGIRRSRAQKIHENDTFNNVMQFVVLVSIIMVGLQVDQLRGRDRTDLNERMGWYVVELLFVAVYIVEAIIRLKALGWRYFDGNKIDFAVVILTTVDQAVFAPLQWESSLDVAYLGRVMRLVRLARVVRFFPMLRRALAPFEKYLTDKIGSAIFWTFLFSAMLTNIVAITLMQVVGHRYDLYLPYLKISGWDWRVEFGSVFKCFMTLCRLIAFDQGILQDTARKVIENQPAMMLFFVLFYLVLTLALMNVLKSMFVTIAVKGTTENKAFKSDVEHKTRQLQLTRLQKLFGVLDIDGGGVLSREELEAAVGEQSIQQVFIDCEIPLDDAMELFDTLDAEGTGELKIDEFLGACSRIKGDAKSKDVYSCKLAVENVNLKMDGVSHMMGGSSRLMLQLDNLVSRIDRVQSKLGNVSKKLKPGKIGSTGTDGRTVIGTENENVLPPFNLNIYMLS